jgi:hypothetical protein
LHSALRVMNSLYTPKPYLQACSAIRALFLGAPEHPSSQFFESFHTTSIHGGKEHDTFS